MTDNCNKITVYYDGACTLCMREIGFYKNRQGAEDIEWVDVGDIDGPYVAADLTKDDAMAKFHVRTPDGGLIKGGDAFARLWSALPGFRPLGRAASVAPLKVLLRGAYALFLPLRPYLQRLVPPLPEATTQQLPKWLRRDLRSNHAGETGAVVIYRGILAVSRHDAVRAFAADHLETERRHLELMDKLVPPQQRSRLLPLWRIAAFFTGALPALFGPRAVYVTIAAVETFVDRHYTHQIDRLKKEQFYPELQVVLESCRADEIQHRDEAQTKLSSDPGIIARGWSALVSVGSAGAVAAARRF